MKIFDDEKFSNVSKTVSALIKSKTNQGFMKKKKRCRHLKQQQTLLKEGTNVPDFLDPYYI